MKLKYELIDESGMDIDDLEAERDLQLAAVDATRRARRFGTFYVMEEDDELQKAQAAPAPLVLNEGAPPSQPQK